MFVRQSKYRHVFGQSSKKDLCYDNINISRNAWDSNIVKANSKYLSVNWESSGGGAFAVIPVNEVGKAPDIVPLFRGHTAPVLDTDFNPFNEDMVASCSDDGKIAIWEIPKDYSFFDYTDLEGEIKEIKPLKKLSGHLRKVGHIKFHPVAENILVSSSNDYSVKVWNILTGKCILTLQHKDLVTSFSFSYDGSKLVTTSRDKKIRIWDLHTGEILQEGPGHSGAKNPRCVWLGQHNRIATTGFSRVSDRQMAVWDSEDLSKGPIGGFYNIDSSAGILMPFFDLSTNLFFIAGKGDGNIRYYEFDNDEMYEISEFQSVNAQRGFALAPKYCCNVKENEVVRAYKTVNDTYIEPIKFIVPRRSEMFQFDLYPDAPWKKAAMTAEEWEAGKKVTGPILFNVESLYDSDVELVLTSSEGKPAPKSEPKAAKVETKPEPKAEPKPEPKVEKAVSSPKAASPVQSPVMKPKSNIDDLLAKKEVSSLLKKAETLDNENDVDSESDNDNDDDFKSQFDEKAVEKTVKSPSLPAAIPKPVLEKKVESKAEPKAEPEAEPKAAVAETPTKSATAPAPAPAAVPATAPASTKGATTLKGTVEKLATLVESLHLEIESLKKINEAKDAKLESLEAKINKLLN